MNNPITTAIQSGRPYLDRFTRREYPKAFRDYEACFRDSCRQALDAGRDHLPQLAGQILDELEEDRRRAHFWDRGTKRFDEKQTVIKYFAPMLLRMGEEAFAQCFREAWCSRWPKDTYEHTTYEALRDAFVNVILGIQLKN